MAWVVAAFSVVWIAVFLYLVRLGRAQREMADEILALKKDR
jgi:CcmD family protein